MIGNGHRRRRPRSQTKRTLLQRKCCGYRFERSYQVLGGFVGVFLPYYFVQIGGNTPTLGVLTFAASLVQLFFLPIGGLMADNYGRRGIIVSVAFLVLFFQSLMLLCRIGAYLVC